MVFAFPSRSILKRKSENKQEQQPHSLSVSSEPEINLSNNNVDSNNMNLHAPGPVAFPPQPLHHNSIGHNSMIVDPSLANQHVHAPQLPRWNDVQAEFDRRVVENNGRRQQQQQFCDHGSVVTASTNSTTGNRSLTSLSTSSSVKSVRWEPIDPLAAAAAASNNSTCSDIETETDDYSQRMRNPMAALPSKQQAPSATPSSNKSSQLDSLEVKIHKAARMELRYLNKAKEIREQRKQWTVLYQRVQKADEVTQMSNAEAILEATADVVKEPVLELSPSIIQERIATLRAKIKQALSIEKNYLKKSKQICNKRYRWSKVYEHTVREEAAADHSVVYSGIPPTVKESSTNQSCNEDDDDDVEMEDTAAEDDALL